MSGRSLPQRFLVWALVVVALDQATKLVVHSTLPLNGTPVRLLGDMLRLTHIHNPGAAFGLFQGNRWFFAGVSLLSMLVLVFLAREDRHRDPWMATSFGLIFGGALGNLIDRLWLGVVIDFLQMGVNGHYWPVYNVADIGVTVGVALLVLRMLFEHRRPEAGFASPGANGPSALSPADRPMVPGPAERSLAPAPPGKERET